MAVMRSGCVETLLLFFQSRGEWSPFDFHGEFPFRGDSRTRNRLHFQGWFLGVGVFTQSEVGTAIRGPG